MKKNLLIPLIIFTLTTFFAPKAVLAARPTGGLLAHYLKYTWSNSSITFNDDWTGLNVTVKPDEALLSDSRVENVNFPNLENELFSVIGRVPYTFVNWTGAIHIDESGHYDFQYVTDAYGRVDIFPRTDPDYCFHTNYNVINTKYINNVYLEEGWHNISVEYPMQWERYDALAILNYKKHSESVYHTFDPSDLSPQSWSDEEVTIPRSADPNTIRLNYVTSGGGGGSGDYPQTKVEIEIDLPAGVDSDDIIDNDVLVVWYNEGGTSYPTNETDELHIKNEITGISATISGTNLYHSPIKYFTLYGWIPDSVINGGTNKLHLSFTKPSTNLPFDDGVAILVPYNDPDVSVSLGQELKMQLLNASAYRRAAPPIVIQLDPSNDNVVSPVFFTQNGETRVHLEDGDPTTVVRPNHMYMAYGDSSQPIPGDLTLIRDLGSSGCNYSQRIIPRNASLNANNVDSYYPAYGREWREMDVLSGRYIPNQWSRTSSQYKTSHDGLINDGTEPAGFRIPAGNSWVAFQLYGVNFPGSGQNYPPESCKILGGGSISLPSTPPTPTRTLDVTIVGSGRVQSSGTMNCLSGTCSETFSDGDPVTLTATEGALHDFSNWSGDVCNGSTNKICGPFNITADTTVTATFTAATTPAQCGYACDTTHCEIPTEGFCVPPSTMSVAGIFENASGTGWEWTCVGTGTPPPTHDCSVERQCGWVER